MTTKLIKKGKNYKRGTTRRNFLLISLYFLFCFLLTLTLFFLYIFFFLLLYFVFLFFVRSTSNVLFLNHKIYSHFYTTFILLLLKFVKYFLNSLNLHRFYWKIFTLLIKIQSKMQCLLPPSPRKKCKLWITQFC